MHRRQFTIMLAVLCAATSVSCFYAASNVKATGPFAAPMPSPMIVAQGVGAANSNHIFVSRAWDFGQIRQAFNTVNISPGDQTAVTSARAAGLAVILEFDYKDQFFAGQDISSEVNAVVQQVQDNPGTISGLWIADRLNQNYSDTQGLSYLAATGGVFHAELPGMPVFTDVSDWQMTCGLPQQASCSSPLLNTTYQYETNAVLTEFYQSGNVDGFFIGDNLQQNNTAAQAQAWQAVRALWPKPFVLISRSSQLAFPDNVYTGTKANANALAAAYITTPMGQGIEGVDHWAWHQVFQGTISSFLNKNTSSNFIWQDMIAGANSLGLTDITPPSVTVTSPTSGATAVGQLVLATITSDNVGATRVDFYVDGNFVGTSITAPFRLAWDSRSVTNGSHVFTAVAFDAAGNSGTSAPVTALTNNPSGSTPIPTATPPPPVRHNSPAPMPTPSALLPASSNTDTGVAANLGAIGDTGSSAPTSSSKGSNAAPTITPAGPTSYTATVKVPVVQKVGYRSSAAARNLGLTGGAASLLAAVLLVSSLF